MKKSLAFLTGICLALSSGFTSAAIIGGWNVGNPVALDASGLVNGSKNVADLAKKSHALIAPVAKDVSKVLVRGAGGFALSIAVEELLGAVDWVMDPANNQIVYKVPSTEPNAIPTSCQYVYKTSSWTHEGPIYGCSLADVGKSWCSSDLVKPGCFATVRGGNEVLVNWECKSDKVCNGYAGTDSSIGFPSKILNPAYDPNGNKEKTLPLDTVSQKIISNAQSGNTDAQAVTVAAAQDILNEAENDAEKAKPIVQQLEANAIVAGIAPHPNKISHDREDEIRNIKPNDPCDEISQAIKDLEETVTWRKSDLNPNEKGTKKYVGHQKRIKILNDKKDDLKRAYTVWCEGN